jgi:Tol biopolymer transport system component
MESGASIFPDGASFAYVAMRPGNIIDADIFVRRIGGENATNLTKNCALGDFNPEVSPDGSSIAYRSECDGGGIFVMGASGKSNRRITDFGYAPSWSPDGRSLLFVTPPGSSQALWIADATTGATRKLFEGLVGKGFWSPSGSRIAFSAWRDSGHEQKRTLWTIPSAGGTPVEVRGVSEGIDPAAWTREGVWYAAPANGTLGSWRVGVDELTGASTSDPVLVVQNGRNLSPAPDGRRVLFQVGTQVSSIHRWDFNPAARAVSPIPRLVISQHRELQLFEEGGAPSPDGKWLATIFIDWVKTEGGDITLVRLDSGETRRLTNDEAWEHSFSWAPDGSRLYFCVAPNDADEIWSIRPDGSGREKVVGGAPEGEIQRAIASPDGRTIFVEAGAENAAYLLDTSLSPSLRRLTPLPPIAEGLSFSPSTGSPWSPDGSELLGYSRTSSGTQERTLWIFSLERNAYRKLATLSSLHNCWWLPGSRRIVIVDAEKGTDFEVKILDRETGMITPAGRIGAVADMRSNLQQSNDGGLFYNLQLSADGRSFYTNTFSPEFDIWMLDYGAAK